MFVRRIKKTLVATAVSAAGVLALTVAPAAAASGTGGGAVRGTIGLWPGLPTGNVCAAQSVTFQPTVMVGAFTAGISVAAGTFTTGTSVSGGTTAYPLPLPTPIGCVGAQE